MARLGHRTRHPQDAHMWSAWRLSVRYERPCRYATGKREKFPSSHVRPRLEKVAYRIDPALWKGHGMGFRQGSLHVRLTVREGSAWAEWRSASEVAFGSSLAVRSWFRERPESAHFNRSALVAVWAGVAPFLPLPPSSTRSDFVKRGLSAALKKGPRLVALRLLRLWPLLLLTPIGEHEPRIDDKDVQRRGGSTQADLPGRSFAG